MTGPSGALVVLGLCTLAMIGVGLRRLNVPPWVSLVVAAALRVLFAAMTSRHYTPHDVASYFLSAGHLVLHGQDPLSHLPGREWNFLELMPYVFALEIKSGLPWVYAAKIAPIAADVVVTWLVYRLAGSEGRTRALQYALNPVSLLVVSLHGQVDPVALAFGLGGVLLAREERWFPAGLLLGAAVAAKTWPVLILLAVIPARRPRQTAQLVGGAAVVPVAMLASGALFLDTHPVSAVRHIASYTSLVADWGWAGTLRVSGLKGVTGYGTHVGHIGALLVYLAAAIALWLFRNRPPAERAMATLGAFLVATAGFGAQYLLWPAALMVAVAGARRHLYIVTAGAWCTVSYLAHWGAPEVYFLAGLSWLVITNVVQLLYGQLWPAGPPWAPGLSPASGSEPAPVRSGR